jgi:hypothetical protein
MREWAVSRALFRVLAGGWTRRRPDIKGRRIGDRLVSSGSGDAPRWVGHGCRRLQPRWRGEAVRRLGIHSPRTNVVGMERYGHSNSWAHSHASTRTSGGVMADSELAAIAVSEPHAASRRQRISPSRIP